MTKKANRGTNGLDQDAQDARSAVQRAEALRLRATGLSYADIGEAMGVAEPTARSLVVRALKDKRAEIDELGDSVIMLEAERLDTLFRAAEAIRVTAKSESMRLQAIDRALWISDRRSKLLGLDAPKREQHEHTLDGLTGFFAAVLEGKLRGGSRDELVLDAETDCGRLLPAAAPPSDADEAEEDVDPADAEIVAEAPAEEP